LEKDTMMGLANGLRVKLTILKAGTTVPSIGFHFRAEIASRFGFPGTERQAPANAQ
jgi:hypothetical protein